MNSTLTEPAGGSRMANRADWTFMVFMAGDNNLSSAGDVDLAEMRRVGSSEQVNVVVEFDNAGPRGTRRIHVRKDGKGEKVESLGETDSGSPEVLSSFISWAAENYPAERYALILWNHGGGWEPNEVDRIARSVDSPRYNGSELNERSSSSLGRAFFRSSLEEVFRLGSPTERAICSDDGTGHSLDTIELGKVIATGAKTIGQRFDLLGMDACLMSNLEVAYQLRNDVRYMVASEEDEPNSGWPYEDILKHLVTDPSIETADFASRIVTDYIASYTGPAPNDSATQTQQTPSFARSTGRKNPNLGLNVTQTAYDLLQIRSMLDPLSTLASYAIKNMDNTFKAIWSASRESTYFHDGTLRDIGQFCEKLGQHSNDKNVKEAAAAVVKAHQVGPGRALIAEAHSGSKVKDCHGSSVYLPLERKLSPFYKELDFAQDSPWPDMLRTYFNRGK